jgi:hypothetical protein
MKRALYTIGLLTITALLAPRPADAQMLRIGAAVGANAPVGDFANAASTGLHLRGLLAIRPPLFPLGIRGEVAYNRIPLDDADNANQIAGILNGVFTLIPSPVINPYLIAGAGLYNTRFGGDAGSTTDLGLNAGLGVRANLLVAELFVESRYEHVLGDGVSPQMIPIIIGLIF